MTDYNHFLMVKTLIDEGADNLYDNLYRACRNGNLGVVQLLLSKGVITPLICLNDKK